MKKTKLRDKKVLLVPFPSMAPSSSASFHRSGEQEPKTPITVQLIELRGFLGLLLRASTEMADCCCFGQKWWEDFEDLYCWGLGCDVLPQFQHPIPHP
jgi:hypothetical protein